MSAASSPNRPPRRRRARAKLRYLADYETECETGQGNAYLRGEGLYSSLISEWRRQRNAGLLEGKNPGEPVGRPTAAQAENARLKAQLRRAEKERDTAEAALEIMGELHALLEDISKSADTDNLRGKR